MSFSESLEKSTVLLKKTTVLSLYSLSTDLTYLPDTFYEKIKLSFKTKHSEDDALIRAIFSHWSQSKSNVNALQSGFIVFISKNEPIFVLENTYFSGSAQSYCQIINLDTIILTKSSTLYFTLLMIVCIFFFIFSLILIF